ncbi:MAG TPA: PDZ domain-containing protein [Chthoniobacterales bacterium]
MIFNSLFGAGRRWGAMLSLLVSAMVAQGQETPVPAGVPEREPVTTEFPGSSVIRVNATDQAYDFFRPWSKKAPVNRRGLGMVIANGNVLVAAELVDNSNYIELEKPDTGEKSTAKIQVVDFEANLALLRPEDPRFLARFKPVEIDSEVRKGDRLSVLQLETNGTPVASPAVVTSVEVGHYELEDTAFLLFRMSCPLQYRDNSFTLPIVKGDRLAAILMRYDTRSQTIDAISSPVIAHFLSDAAHPPYHGFPRIGLSYAATRDPQLRHFLKLKDGDGGIYVTGLDPNGPAAKAGLQEGDIVLGINQQPIDADGNYLDPKYGRVSVTNLTTAAAYAGEILDVALQRRGLPQHVQVALFHVAPEDYVIDPYVIDRPPKFYILGGMVFQELTRQFLKEWGANWPKEAPQRFVYYDRFQGTLFPEKRKVVILTQVMPTKATIGYEHLNYLVVKRLNGRDVRNLDDLAQASQAPVDGFQKVEFEEDPHMVYLDAREVAEDSRALQQLYSLPSMQRL